MMMAAISFSDICSSVEVSVDHITPLNDSYLYIGSTASLKVSLSLPKGFIKLTIAVSQNDENIDVISNTCTATNDEKYFHEGHNWNRYKATVRFGAPDFFSIQAKNLIHAI
jgi:hypothetical protein